MKLLLLNKQLIHTEINEKTRTVTARIKMPGYDQAFRMYDIFPIIENLNIGLFDLNMFGLISAINISYIAKATCAEGDVFNPKIGKEIAYLRLCKKYLILMEKMATQRFHVFLKRNSDYSETQDDITFDLPWGNKRHVLTMQFIDKQLTYLYNKGNINLYKLLPCPFCGSDNVAASGMTFFNTSQWQVKCNSCGAIGAGKGEMFTRIQAIKAWNKSVERK